jgi:hypothetical protein
MSEAELARLQGDLAVIQRALGLRISFGKGMLVFGVLLALVAMSAAVASFSTESVWLQLIPFTAILVLCLLGLYLRSRRTADFGHEVTLQVVLSITIYFAVIGAACGYMLAALCGPDIGAVRTAALYACSLTYISIFLVILLINAFKRRERYYCLGLAVPLLLTGLLLPVLDKRYSISLAHGFMAVGFLTGVAIQWFQLRKAQSHNAAN